MMNTLSWLVICGILASVQCKKYYLDQANGNDDNDGRSVNNAFASVKEAFKVVSAGDTLLIVGVLSNPSYDPNYSFQSVSDAQLWNGENTLRLNRVSGKPGKWITITSYDSSTVIKGDGSNIVRLTRCSYIQLVDLKIEGEVQRIPYSTAKALQFVYKDENGNIQYRVNTSLTDTQIGNLTLPKLGSNIKRASYTDTRGMYISHSDHILVKNNLILNMPGGGFRASYCEYVDVIGNEIVNTSRKSYSGTHGLVLTYTKDELDKENSANYRARVVRNVVHHNYNEIYSWVGTKTFIHTRIDEGKGISLQRNEQFQNGGRILVANNIAYWNGYSGIHSNDGMNVDMIANTAYMNSYTNSVTYKNEKKGGLNVGISISNGKDCTILNNIAVVDTSFQDWQGYAISAKNDSTSTLRVTSNVIFGVGNQPMQFDPDVTSIEKNTIVEDPLFKETVGSGDSQTGNSKAFKVRQASPAVEKAREKYEPCEDAFGKTRTSRTIGAADFGTSNAYDSNGDLTQYLESVDDCYDIPFKPVSSANEMRLFGLLKEQVETTPVATWLVGVLVCVLLLVCGVELGQVFFVRSKSVSEASLGSDSGFSETVPLLTV